MAKRWVIGGLAVGVGALVLAPEARTWLRRRLGLEPEDRRWFEEDGAEPAEYEGDEPLDTREARYSLRARLSEDGPAEAEETPPSEPEAATAEPEPEPEPAAAAPAEPEAEPEAAPAPPAYSPSPRYVPPPVAAPAPAPAYESVPPVSPEVDAPKTPGEDTNEIEPLPPANRWEAPAAPPPPTPLRPPAPARPFSGEGASFRSAIDAARERVHEAAREATPDEGESTEPIEGA